MTQKLSPRELDTWGLVEILRLNAILDMREDLDTADHGYNLMRRDAEGD